MPKTNELLKNLRARLEAEPEDLDALADLAGLLAQAGERSAALALLEPALKAHPGHVVVRHNLAEMYRTGGDSERAEELFVELLERAPRFLPAYQSLAAVLAERLAMVAAVPGQAQALRVRLAILSNNWGNALHDSGQIEAAEAGYREALDYWPDYPSAHSNLANVLRIMGQPCAAEVHARRALALHPEMATAWNNLGTALSEQGRYAAAAACYQRALALDATLEEAEHNAGSGSLMLLLYRDDVNTGHIADVHRRWGEALPSVPRPAASRRGKKRRIGFVSADFREHSVMYFAEGLLAHLDRDEFEVFCYANQHGEDEVTRRIRALPVAWRWIADMSDAQFCAQVGQDGIDLLIDLSGHTKGNRLAAFALRPAPLAATWLGYPFTSGLPAIDFRITDALADPPAYARDHHVEQPAYVSPSQFNYRPREDAPAVASLPALRNGHITFGSLNNVQKLNRTLIEVWSRILRAQPSSRLLLHHKLLADPGIVGRIRGLFEAFGVDGERLDLRPASVTHLPVYHEIDIALDSFPYNGATTTCEALWMGVPVLSLASDNPVSRMGASLLGAARLEGWSVESVDDYVQRALARSADVPALAALRSALRTRMAASPLCDSRAFAQNFGQCLHRMIDGATARESKSF